MQQAVSQVKNKKLHRAKNIACNSRNYMLQGVMATAQEIAQAADVTEAYARMLHAGTRKPSLGVALKIYDATGEQLGPLAGLPKGAIKVARKMAA